MTKKGFLMLAAGLALGSAAFAQEGAWIDMRGRPVQETEARRSLNGLTANVVVTPDEDWREKWETPAHTVPHFNETTSVERGQQVFVLIFFANPKTGMDGRADLTCDLDVVRPDGSTSAHHENTVCFQGELKGGPYNVYLADPVIGFTGDPGDAAGTWTVRITLTDNVGKTVLPLKTSFVLR